MHIFDVFFCTIRNKGMKFQNDDQKNFTILMVSKSIEADSLSPYKCSFESHHKILTTSNDVLLCNCCPLFVHKFSKFHLFFRRWFLRRRFLILFIARIIIDNWERTTVGNPNGNILGQLTSWCGTVVPLVSSSDMGAIYLVGVFQNIFWSIQWTKSWW